MTYLSKFVKAIDYTGCVGELDRIKERTRWRKEAAETLSADMSIVVDLIAQSSQIEAADNYLCDLDYLLRLVERQKSEYS